MKKEETGVGAAKAAGSQDEKGTCYLFEIKMKAIIIIVANNTVYSFKKKIPRQSTSQKIKRQQKTHRPHDWQE